MCHKTVVEYPQSFETGKPSIVGMLHQLWTLLMIMPQPVKYQVANEVMQRIQLYASSMGSWKLAVHHLNNRL